MSKHSQGSVTNAQCINMHSSLIVKGLIKSRHDMKYTHLIIS